MKEKQHIRPHFRFEDLEIWQLAKELAVVFNQVAEKLEQRKLYRYAEQLRAAGLSLSNNIAEGAGSIHDKEFNQFLNIARRSLFEDASMLFVFEAMQLINHEDTTMLLWKCDNLSRKITNFMKSLTKHRGKGQEREAER
jgi:four helix bundle protein